MSVQEATIEEAGSHMVKKNSFIDQLLHELAKTKHERPESIRLRDSDC